VASTQPYSHLFSPWQIRHTRIANRVIFGPVCPTWVRSAHEGVFTEQAVAYYEERAKTGIGMIILGGHLIIRTRFTLRPRFQAFGTRTR
jgi:2,4-dienoyl-CoA reductase-like NADH-dependent reductase (Old Yellow Enzyme family)